MLRSEVHRFYYSTTDASVIDKLDIQLRKDEIELLPEVFYTDKPRTIINTLENYLCYLWDNKDYLILDLLYSQRNKNSNWGQTYTIDRKIFIGIIGIAGLSLRRQGICFFCRIRCYADKQKI